MVWFICAEEVEFGNISHTESRFPNGCQESQCCLGSECSQGDWAMMTRAQEDDLDELRNGRH